MSKHYRTEDFKKGIVRIIPEGWVDSLVLETTGFHQCGQTDYGMGIRINNDAGGVLTLDDMATLIGVFTEHLQKVAAIGEEQL